MKSKKIVNVAEIASKDWTFLQDKMQNCEIEWRFYSSQPIKKLEHFIKTPRLSRLRACFLAVREAKRINADLIISHMPQSTIWVAFFAILLNVRIKHIAFTFNFTKLPKGIRREFIRFLFQHVDKMIVSTRAETFLYSSHFNLNIEQFDFLPWAMDKPIIDSKIPLVSGNYVCAVGGEGRDYRTLIESIKELEYKFVIVARPHNLVGLNLPDNVELFTNVSYDNFWNIINFSKCVLVPLENENINNGHISLVGSFALAKPILSSLATGTQDYVIHGYNGLLSKARDIAGLKNNIQLLLNDHNLSNKLSLNAEATYEKNHNVSKWCEYIKASLILLD